MLRHLRVPFLKRLSDECDRAVIISGQGLRTSFHLSLPLSTCTTSHLTRFPDGRHAVRGIRLPNLRESLSLDVLIDSHTSLIFTFRPPLFGLALQPVVVLRPLRHDLPPRLSLQSRVPPTCPLHYDATVRWRIEG